MTAELVDWQLMDDAPFKKNATYADLDTLPETWVGELIDGDLYAFPRPRTTHSHALTQLMMQLGSIANDRPDGWTILHDVEIWFGKNLLVPDVCGWRNSRLPELPDVVTMKLAPDWVCEGLSRSTARLDKGRKREIYAKGGVRHIWYADPALLLIEVLALEGKSYRVVETAGGETKKKLPPFEHALDLSRCWRPTT